MHQEAEAHGTTAHDNTQPNVGVERPRLQLPAPPPPHAGLLLLTNLFPESKHPWTGDGPWDGTAGAPSLRLHKVVVVVVALNW